MLLKTVLALLCVVLAASRNVEIEKLSLALTEDSKENLDQATFDIIQSFLSENDVTSGDELDDLLQGCSKGKCEFCKSKMGHKVCFVVTVLQNGFQLSVTLDGKTVVKKDINVPNPPAVCKKNIPGLKMIKDVCVQLKDVDLKNMSGCVYISFKVSFKKMSFKVACFKIPHVDGAIPGEIDLLQNGSVLEFEPFDNNAEQS